MSEDKHTPLPWKWHKDYPDHSGTIYAEPKEGHAYAIAIKPRYETTERWKSNAALIVRSVNAVPALVKALEETEKSFEVIRQMLIGNLNEPERSAFWRAVQQRDAVRADLAAYRSRK